MIYVVYRITKAVMINKLKKMAGQSNSRVRGSNTTHPDKRNIEDAKFTVIDEDDPKGKE